MNILVVDDERDIQLLFKQRFRKEIKQGNLSFSFAFSSEEALDFLRNKEASSYLVLILADINMPGMNGLELLKIIKATYSQFKVFMITAYEDEKNYNAAINYGADDYLYKPIAFEILKEKIWELSSILEKETDNYGIS